MHRTQNIWPQVWQLIFVPNGSNGVEQLHSLTECNDCQSSATVSISDLSCASETKTSLSRLPSILILSKRFMLSSTTFRGESISSKSNEPILFSVSVLPLAAVVNSLGVGSERLSRTDSFCSRYRMWFSRLVIWLWLVSRISVRLCRGWTPFSNRLYRPLQNLINNRNN